MYNISDVPIGGRKYEIQREARRSLWRFCVVDICFFAVIHIAVAAESGGRRGGEHHHRIIYRRRGACSHFGIG